MGKSVRASASCDKLTLLSGAYNGGESIIVKCGSARDMQDCIRKVNEESRNYMIQIRKRMGSVLKDCQ
jgi:hypothetical protein